MLAIGAPGHKVSTSVESKSTSVVLHNLAWVFTDHTPPHVVGTVVMGGAVGPPPPLLPPPHPTATTRPTIKTVGIHRKARLVSAMRPPPCDGACRSNRFRDSANRVPPP